jgi:hypothetical protein
MPDNLHLRGRPDQARINVHEDWELRHWSQKFGVTSQQLINAVRAVGPMAADVARHLGKPL